MTKVTNVQVLEHGTAFVAEEMKDFNFNCPECDEHLDATSVLTVEPNTRHQHDPTHRTKFVTMFCGECGCKFKLTVK